MIYKVRQNVKKVELSSQKNKRWSNKKKKQGEGVGTDIASVIVVFL